MQKCRKTHRKCIVAELIGKAGVKLEGIELRQQRGSAILWSEIIQTVSIESACKKDVTLELYKLVDACKKSQ